MQYHQEKKNFKSKNLTYRQIQKWQLGPYVPNQSSNEALDQVFVSLLVVNNLLTKSYEVLAYASKRSLQLHWCADGLEFKLRLHSIIIQL